jgi:hypothetical protein
VPGSTVAEEAASVRAVPRARTEIPRAAPAARASSRRAVEPSSRASLPSSRANGSNITPSLAALAALAALVTVSGGCVGRERVAVAKGPPLGAALPARPTGSRWFLGDLTNLSWAHHDDAGDLVVVSGARIEADASGVVLRAGWADEDLGLGETTLSQRVPAHLGGGFLHASVMGSESTLTRSSEFTGPVAPVAKLATQVRGIRPGLRELVLMAESGVFGLEPRSGAVRPAPFGALADVIALDATRAVRLDLFGRAYVTRDGGATFRDAQLDVGASTRLLATSGSDVWLETAFGRALVEPGGLRVVSEQPYQRWGREYQRPFQLVPKGPLPRQDTWINGWNPNEMSAAGVAARAGVSLSDGTIVAAQRSVVVHFDPGLGKARSVTTSWFPNGLECRATPGPARDEVLYACSFDDGTGFGRYVLRGEGAAPPRVERFFGGGASFVGTLDGGLAYLGDCSDTPTSYQDRGWQDPTARTKVVCVRRASGDWVERRLPLPDDEVVHAWVPTASGEIAALVRPVQPRIPLPRREGSLRPGEPPRRPLFVSEGVRVLRVELPVGLGFSSSSLDGGYGDELVEHRFALHEDGSISGWLGNPDGVGPLAPVAWSSDGALVPRELPDDTRVTAAAGGLGVAIDGLGMLHETRDFGRTWQPAGRSPLPPQSSGLQVGACSQAGCALGGLARLGWGASTVQVTVTEYDVEQGRPRLAVAAGELPVLACAPVGLPTPIPQVKHASSPTTFQTPWGDTVEVLREIEEREAAKKAALPPLSLPPAPPSKTPSSPPPPVVPSSGPVLSTATWVYRPPFDRALLPRRINATNAAELAQRPAATLVVDRAGVVALHLIADKGEALLDDDDLVALPLFERRYASSSLVLSTGARLGRDRVLMLGESRGRLGIESHGVGTQPPPAGLVADRRLFGRRNVAVGHRPGGGLALLVLDGAPARSAGMIALDPLGTSPVGDAQQLAPWSTLTRGDDPACASDEGVRAVLLLESSWLELASDELPGLSTRGPGRYGSERNLTALVRWSAGRVCLDAVRVGAFDTRRGSQVTLVSVWGQARSAGKGAKAVAPKAAAAAEPGVLRTKTLHQPVRCDVVRPKAPTAAKAP